MTSRYGRHSVQVNLCIQDKVSKHGKICAVSYFPVGCEKQCSEYGHNPPIPAYGHGKKWINISINWRHSCLRNVWVKYMLPISTSGWSYNNLHKLMVVSWVPESFRKTSQMEEMFGKNWGCSSWYLQYLSSYKRKSNHVLALEKKESCRVADLCLEFSYLQRQWEGSN